ncbi:MAG: hypothetical protein R2849_01060 [Thermomicrobiales bacterium]
MVIDIATHSSAQVIGSEGYGLEPDCSADFVLVDGETHVEAVIERPDRWLVVKRGRMWRVTANAWCNRTYDLAVCDT